MRWLIEEAFRLTDLDLQTGEITREQYKRQFDLYYEWLWDRTFKNNFIINRD